MNFSQKSVYLLQERVLFQVSPFVEKNGKRTSTATSAKKNFSGSTALATTAIAITVQQTSLVDQNSDLPTLPYKSYTLLEEQLKWQQLLIDKLKNRCKSIVSMHLKVMFSFWRGKLQSRKRSIIC